MASRPAPAAAQAVQIVEVGPRDGLQNVQNVIPTALKVELIRRLAGTGLSTIEATSFVSPKWIPQLADCREVLASLESLIRAQKIQFPVLVPNSRAFQAGIKSGARCFSVFVSATEGFSKKNTNCSVDEALARASEILKQAKQKKVPVRGYVSCIFACPYDGPTPPERVLHVVQGLLTMGCYEISLGDTLGIGTPADVTKLLEFLYQHTSPKVLAGHFHDTYGQALANVLTAYNMGIRTFDSSVAGLGGCPYAEGATGNLASEDVVYMFDKLGVSTGVNLDALVDVGSWISEKLKHENSSRAGTALSKRRSRVTQKPLVAPRQWEKTGGSDEYSVLRAGSNLKVILTRPRNGNALTRTMLHSLTALLKRIATDTSISRVIITAEGKFFCTGMDLSGNGAVTSSKAAEKESQFHELQRLFEVIDHLPQVTIARINGPCFGGGVGLAFVCDIRLATASSSFTLSEVKLGLCPAIISKYITREWGVPYSREAMLTGREIDPLELRQLGIVHGISQDLEALDGLLEQRLDALRHCAPRASSLCKKLVTAGWQHPGAGVQAETISAAYDEMMKPSREAAYGLGEFRRGNRKLDWDNISSPRDSKL